MAANQVSVVSASPYSKRIGTSAFTASSVSTASTPNLSSSPACSRNACSSTWPAAHGRSASRFAGSTLVNAATSASCRRCDSLRRSRSGMSASTYDGERGAALDLLTICFAPHHTTVGHGITDDVREPMVVVEPDGLAKDPHALTSPRSTIQIGGPAIVCSVARNAAFIQVRRSVLTPSGRRRSVRLRRTR